MKKKIICLNAILTLTLACSTQVFASDFSDIEYSYSKEQIEYFDEEGFFEIFTKGEVDKFYPEKSATRGEFVVLFQNLLGLEGVENSQTVPFVDVSTVSQDLLPYVESAYFNGVISGKLVDGKLHFGFNDNITRQEMLTIIGRYLNLTSDDEILFKDAKEVSPWAKQYVSYFYNNQIVRLDENGDFNPKEFVSREEVVETLYFVKNYAETQVDNGLKVENYIGNSKLGYKNDSYENSTFTMITDVDFNAKGELLISDSLANQIRIASNGKVSTLVGTHKSVDFAGLPIGGYVDGKVDVAVLDKPNKILVYDENTILFTQEDSSVIRGYDIKNKKVYTVAGMVESGYKEGNNAIALFNNPQGLARDSKGNIYVADTLNNVIRKIDKDMNVTLYAGTPNAFGNVVGDLKDAKFNEPTDLFIINDVLYVSDSGNNMIKKIENNKVEVVAGVNTYLDEETQTQIGGDRDGSTMVAQFNYPTGIFVDEQGIVYVADSENNKIKVIENGNVKTIAGSGDYGNDLGNALQATFDYPSGITVKNGVVYVADKNNYTVKSVSKNK